MIEFLVWVLVAYGVTNIVVFGKIFESTRFFFTTWGNEPKLKFHNIAKFISELISCPMCFGFWVGVFLNIFFYSPIANIYGLNQIYSIFFDAVLSSGSVWVIYNIINYFEE